MSAGEPGVVAAAAARAVASLGRGFCLRSDPRTIPRSPLRISWLARWPVALKDENFHARGKSHDWLLHSRCLLS